MNDFFATWMENNEETRRGVAQELLMLKATEALHEAMEKTGITKTELAAKLGKTQSHVSQMLKGKRNMTLRSLADMAFAMGCEIDISLNAQADNGWQEYDQTVTSRHRDPKPTYATLITYDYGKVVEAA